MRNLAVTVFGVFPAGVLCYFVFPITVYFIGAYVDGGGFDALLSMTLCVLAVIGTFALFFSIDSAPGPVRIVGLGCGIIAMYGLGGFSQIGPSLGSLVYIGPVATAVFLIIEGTYKLAGRTDVPDHWSY